MLCTYPNRKHKKHRSKHRQKDSGSESGAEGQDGEDMELIDNLLEAGLERTVAVPRQAAAAAAAGRDVEIRHATAGNGVIESMKIVVNNRNGTDEQVSHWRVCEAPRTKILLSSLSHEPS